MSKAAELAALIANVNKGSSLANKNLVINGAMNIAQRGTSSTSEGYQTVDRFFFQANSEDNLAFTQAQSTDAPTGFSNSYKIDCTTVESALASDELAYVAYKPEAQDCMITLNGTANAKPLTLSFYVKSNKTGTYAVTLYKPDNTGRSIGKTYTISSANTWEYKSVTFEGDTSGGGLNDDNGEGIDIYFTLMAGSDFTSSDGTSWHNYANAQWAFGHNVNMFDNTANEWLLTGVQLEIGEKATEFEHISPNVEIERCKRYYTRYNSTAPYQRLGGSGFAQTTDDFGIFVKFSPEMRDVPTLDHGTLSKLQVDYRQTAAAIGSLAIDGNTDGGHSVNLSGADVTGDPLTAGDGVLLRANNDTDAYIAFDAEL